MKNKKTLLIDNRDSFTYNIVELLRKIENVTCDIVKVDQIELSDIKSYDNIIISPGPELPENYPVLDQVIEKYKTKKPILGICLGHQAICTYFGAGLVNLANVFHGHQQKVEIIDDDKILRGVSSGFDVGLYHSWVVDWDNLPNVLQVTSRSEAGHIMSVRHLQYDIYGLQFHPESFLTEKGKDIISNFLNI